jgi:hypothetical protein
MALSTIFLGSKAIRLAFNTLQASDESSYINYNIGGRVALPGIHLI